jgi:hypothetical protein
MTRSCYPSYSANPEDRPLTLISWPSAPHALHLQWQFDQRHITESRRDNRRQGNYSPPFWEILLDTVTAESPTGEG